MTESKYSEKLKDPRWQKKRLEIFQRDEWKCQLCGDTESTLVVHHRDYLRGKDPWDYPDLLLVTLCEDCHEGELYRSEAEQTLLGILRNLYLQGKLLTIVDAFERLPKRTDLATKWGVPETLNWLTRNPPVLQELVKRSWDESEHKLDWSDSFGDIKE